MEDEMVVIVITAPSLQICRQIATELLARKWIACANILPAVQSLYSWKGEIQDEEEVLMVCKSRSSLFPEICAGVKSLHPYKIPEIIALPIQHGLPAYLEWIEDVTQA